MHAFWPMTKMISNVWEWLWLLYTALCSQVVANRSALRLQQEGPTSGAGIKASNMTSSGGVVDKKTGAGSMSKAGNATAGSMSKAGNATAGRMSKAGNATAGGTKSR